MEPQPVVSEEDEEEVQPVEYSVTFVESQLRQATVSVLATDCEQAEELASEIYVGPAYNELNWENVGAADLVGTEVEMMQP